MEPAAPRERAPDAAPSILRNPLHHVPRWSRQRGGYVTYITKPLGPPMSHAILVMPKRALKDARLFHIHHGICRNRFFKWMDKKGKLSCRRPKTSSETAPDEIEPMDPEELAMLNSIINTRRSMAAAQALAKQDVPSDTPKSRPSSRPASTATAHVQFAPLPFPEDNESDVASGASSPSDVSLAPSLPESSTSMETDAPSSERDTPTSTLYHRIARAWSLRSTDSLTLRRWPSIRRSPSPSLEEDDSDSSSSSPRVSLEERRRRRRHIRSQRPGGTGMVTLLDGKRIPARQVGDPQQEQDMDDDLQAQLWGFAALERQRERVQAPRLSSERAAEMRRRHEDEMAALGAEALQKVRGDNKNKAPARPQRVDPSISMPSPSPHLPRRPDAKGISVVPLPQLGHRPVLPYEGRSWIYTLPVDDMDHSSDTKPRNDGLRRRATTQAAGQEVVHASRHKHRDGWENEFWPQPSATRSLVSGPG